MSARPNWFTYGRNRYRLEFWSLGPKKRGDLAAVRFGPLLYIDEEVWEGLGAGLRAALAARAIRVRHLSSSSLADALAYYTFPAVTMMLKGGFAGKRVVDAGSGDGLLALTAAKLGASEISLVEIDPGALDRARAHLRANGLREGSGFHVVRADLTQTASTLENLPPRDLPTVVLGSIGTWIHNYTATNADVLALAAGLSQVERIILTGYASGAPNGGLYHMRQDQELARLLGWRIDALRGSWSRRMTDLWPLHRNNYFHLAFSARVPPGLPSERGAFERMLARLRGEHRVNFPP